MGLARRGGGAGSTGDSSRFSSLAVVEAVLQLILTKDRDGNFKVVVDLKSLVEELTWLLIGCLKTKNQSGAKFAL